MFAAWLYGRDAEDLRLFCAYVKEKTTADKIVLYAAGWTMRPSADTPGTPAPQAFPAILPSVDCHLYASGVDWKTR